MRNDFVPLVAAKGALATAPAAAPKLKVLSQAAAAACFQPLLAALSEQSSQADRPVPAPIATKPVVTLQRDGGHVTHIRVQCACGEVIDLECVYPAS